MTKAERAARDLRSPLAKARDEYLNSPEGEAMIRLCGGDQYARNRVEKIWLAGVAWMRERAEPIFRRIESGYLVRNTEKDHEPGWALEASTFVMQLKHFMEALGIEEPSDDLRTENGRGAGAGHCECDDWIMRRSNCRIHSGLGG